MLRTHRPPPAFEQSTSLQATIVAHAIVLTAFVIVTLSTLSFVVTRTLLERATERQISLLIAAAEDALEREQVRSPLASENAGGALQSLLAFVESLGKNGEIIVVRERGNLPQLLYRSPRKFSDANTVSPDLSDPLSHPLVAPVLRGEEGVTHVTDERGRDMLAGYRYLPSFGWGLIFQIERDEAVRDARALARTHAYLGIALLLLAIVLTGMLARQIAQPVMALAAKVRHLRPGHWRMRRSVRTGDEVEQLDVVTVDLAKRLHRVYASQTREIARRTKELQKQYALDEVILERVGYGIVTIDGRGHITGWNPAAEDMFQLRLSSIGATAADALPVCGEDGKPLREEHPLKECLKKRKVIRYPAAVRAAVRRRDGSVLPVTFIVSPLLDRQTLFGAVAVFQDVTEERHLDTLKSEFISLASHQLRTPLSSVRWYLELLADRNNTLTKTERGYLREMERATRRMTSLLSSLLHAMQMEGSGIRPRLEKIDLQAMVQELQQGFGSQAEEKSLRHILLAPRRPLFLRTDPTLLRSVVQNLLSNAVKYSPSNKTITVTLRERGKNVEISVRDEGVGIPKREQQRVFDRFFRATNVRRMDTDGNGLGLSISRSIVQHLGGKISFRSTENRGTVFTVRLPREPHTHGTPRQKKKVGGRGTATGSRDVLRRRRGN